MAGAWWPLPASSRSCTDGILETGGAGISAATSGGEGAARMAEADRIDAKRHR